MASGSERGSAPLKLNEPADTVPLPGVADARDSAPDIVASRYVLGPWVGEGGGGTVREALDRLTGETVALKLIRGGWSVAAAHARREVASLRYLRLPGVVRLRDEGRHEDDSFIVMDRLKGTPLFSKAQQSWEEIRGPLLALLETLSQVHAAGIVHRDLKPGNVLLVDGRPILLDFGIAQGDALAPVTRQGMEGTWGYMPPEQIEGRPCDERADLFALGAMLWEALGGRLARSSRTFAFEEVREGGVGEPSGPTEVLALLRRMRAPDREDRPASADAVIQALGGRSASEAIERLVAELPDTAEPSLRELFHGPDVFLHLREDAAAILSARAGPEREDVVAELDRWVRRGQAHLEDGRVRIERPALDRLRVDEALFDPNVDPDVVVSRAEADIVTLRMNGHAARATALVQLALASARGMADRAAEERLLGVLVELALEQESVIGLDEALHEVGRVEQESENVANLALLVQARRAAVGEELDRASEMFASLQPFNSEIFEIWRHGFSALAQGPPGSAARGRALDALRWWSRRGSRLRRSYLAGWLGTQRYAQARYRDAARLHLVSANGRERRGERLSAIYNAACSLIEVAEFQRARDLAAQGMEEAERSRHPGFECRLTWVDRTASYRSGAPMHARPELVDAAARISRGVEAMHGLTEAAIAWREGQPDTARALAGRARRAFRVLGRASSEALAGALEAAASFPAPPSMLAEVVERVASCALPDITAQVFGLLLRATPSPPAQWLVAARAAAARVPQLTVDVRMDVLSLAEAIVPPEGVEVT